MARRSGADDAAANLYNGISLLARRLRQQHEAGGLSMPERAVLSRLDRTGPATAAELARAEQITPQAMGSTLTGLQRQGYVERHADPHDKRRVIMSVTPAGRAVRKHKRDAQAQRLAELLGSSGFTPAEVDTLRAAGPLLERLAERL